MITLSCQKLRASHLPIKALRGACLQRVKLRGPLAMALASQCTLALVLPHKHLVVAHPELRVAPGYQSKRTAVHADL